MFKIQKNSLEMKIREPLEIEEEYENFKEKVKYKGGTFLNSDKKDKEIVLLRKQKVLLNQKVMQYELIVGPL